MSLLNTSFMQKKKKKKNVNSKSWETGVTDGLRGGTKLNSQIHRGTRLVAQNIITLKLKLTSLARK